MSCEKEFERDQYNIFCNKCGEIEELKELNESFRRSLNAVVRIADSDETPEMKISKIKLILEATL